MRPQTAVLGALLAIVPALVPTLHAPLAAQAGAVSGLVTDQDTGRPLVGVQVAIEGTSLRTSTGADGRYTLRGVPAGTHTVSAQTIGYAPAQRPRIALAPGAAATVDFALRASALPIEGLVVTGVVDPVAGVRLPFTVARVDRENLQVPATGGAVAAIQGKVAGANVVRASGQPGTGASVILRTPTSIRSSNTPLYVVDGVVLGTSFSPLTSSSDAATGTVVTPSGMTVDLSSLDIESVEVVKGAAAASLYGSRAASGVISITTSRGKALAPGRTRITARTEYGQSYAPNNLDLASHHHWRMNEQGRYVDAQGKPIDSLQLRVPDVDRIMDNPYPGRTYDNLSALYRPGRYVTQSVSVGQNTQATNFFAALNANREAGTLENNDGLSLNEFRLNLDHRPRQDLSLGISAFHSRSRQDEYSGDPFWDILMYQPDVDLRRKDASGQYLQVPDPSVLAENPLWRQGSRDNENLRARSLASGEVRWSPTWWLTLGGNYSYDRADVNGQVYVPKGTPLSVTAEQPSDGSLTRNHRATDANNGSLTLTLHRSFGELNARSTLRGLIEREKSQFVSAQGTDFIVKDVPDLDAARTRTVSSSLNEVRSNGYFLQTGLDYADKYIADFLVRRDGSSLFGPDARWQTYYRTAFAYRLGQEPWFRLPRVDELKLKYSRGTAGGRPSFANQYETWNVSSTGVTKGTLGNRNLRPEHTTEQEFGVDMVVFGRLSLELVYATQVTRDQLLEIPVAAITGYSTQWANTGVNAGHTYEASIQARLIEGRDLSWSMTLVADRSRTRIREWNRACFIETLRNFCGGASVGEMWGQAFLSGADQLPEHLRGRANEFQVNDDGYLVWVGPGGSWTDRRWGTSFSEGGVTYNWGHPILRRDANGFPEVARIGSSEADLNLGHLNNLRWKGLSLHTHFQAQLGGDVYNGTRQRLYQNLRHGDLDQTGKPEERKKPVDYYLALYNSNDNTAEFVEPGSFLKLRSLSVLYRFSRAQLSRVGLGSIAPEELGIGLTGRNLYTLTGYSGYDPEVGSPLQRYDYFTYPNTRSLTATVELSF